MKTKKAKVISSTLQKGGVGKTIFAVNVAAFLSTLEQSDERLNKVMLIDIDNHSSATKYLGQYNDSNLSIYDVLTGQATISEATISLEYSFGKNKKNEDVICNLDLVPSAEVLHYIENKDNCETLLKDALDEVIYDYDYIIIDCPPESDTLLKNAFNCTDYYILPVLPEANSFQELSPTIAQIEDLTSERETGKILGCVINEARRKKTVLVNDLEIDMKSMYEQVVDVFDTIIPYSDAVDNSFAMGVPIPFYHKNYRPYYYRIFTAFLDLTLEILDKIDKYEKEE